MAKWSDQELVVFRTVYPHCGTVGVHALLPHRSKGTIGVRACTEGLHRLPKEQRKTLDDLQGALPVIAPPVVVKTVSNEPANTHIWFPCTPEGAQQCAAACDYLARGCKAIADAGPEVQNFSASLAVNLRERAERMDASRAA